MKKLAKRYVHSCVHMSYICTMAHQQVTRRKPDNIQRWQRQCYWNLSHGMGWEQNYHMIYHRVCNKSNTNGCYWWNRNCSSFLST